MLRTLLKSKIHRATITDADVDYMGSITVCRDLMRLADLWPGEKVLVADVDNGNRLETYVIPGQEGTICINGAAARKMHEGDTVIIMSFAITDQLIEPKIILVDSNNRLLKQM